MKLKLLIKYPLRIAVFYMTVPKTFINFRTLKKGYYLQFPCIISGETESQKCYVIYSNHPFG